MLGTEVTEDEAFSKTWEAYFRVQNRIFRSNQAHPDCTGESNGVLGRARRGAVNNGVAISGVKKEGILRHRCRHRPVQYLNNILAQDHRRAKGRLCPMLGFKTFYNALRVIIGIELAQNIHKRQFAIPITWQSKPAMIWRFWMFARC